MGKIEGDSNQKGVCEKIFSTLCCPSFRTNNHHAHTELEQITQPDQSGYSKRVQIKAGMPKAEMNLEPQVNDDAFSEYIDRTKFKITAMSSNVGIDKVASRAGDLCETNKQEDHSNDVFTDFVKRAKFKIRKTSSIGNSRKNISFNK